VQSNTPNSLQRSAVSRLWPQVARCLRNQPPTSYIKKLHFKLRITQVVYSQSVSIKVYTIYNRVLIVAQAPHTHLGMPGNGRHQLSKEGMLLHHHLVHAQNKLSLHFFYMLTVPFSYITFILGLWLQETASYNSLQFCRSSACVLWINMLTFTLEITLLVVLTESLQHQVYPHNLQSCQTPH
jgi:hypothetical protein